MIADPVSILYQLGHSTSGPEVSKKAVVLGPFGKELGEFGQLILGQEGLSPRGRIAYESILALLSCPLQPLAYRCRADSKGFCDIYLQPTLALEFQSSKPSSFSPVPRSS